MIKIATFQSDATPPLGSPLCMGLVKPVKKIVEPLLARGLVILGNEAPVVICTVDWVEIRNSGHDYWRKVLAEAADTTIERVTIHTHHPHDTPGYCFSQKDLTDLKAIAGIMEDTSFAENVALAAAKALHSALASAKPVTHYGYGKAKVSQVASNRRILGNDGRVAQTRWSSCTDKALRDLPEGLIDPWLQNLSFWNGEEPLASLTYYATHPQSFYGDGAVNPDFVGLARSIRESTLPEVAHLHFDGCGGNIAAGKYNDHSPKNRLILAQRLLKGMEAAWAKTRKYPLKDSDFCWRVKPVALPVSALILKQTENDLLKTINNVDEAKNTRIIAAFELIWKRRRQSGCLIDLSCLRLGKISVLHLPGEMLIEYQLAARQMRPSAPVLVAAYGDCGPGYVGTKKSYAEGGYETSQQASHVAPEVEEVIMEAMRELLR
ncbi:MAG: hypothetical protein NT011_07190 [Kiritimatiellaeota bacterium]|nr:hypothetical protein [Kiritimatiellota bacterium]